MSKAYICAPYTSKAVRQNSRDFGKIKDESYKNFLEAVEFIVKGSGFTTFLPHRDIHKWGDISVEPEEVVKLALEEIKSCDLFIALPENSKGVNVELGWASALKKKIVILINERGSISSIQKGLNGLTETHIVLFRDIQDLRVNLRSCLHNLQNSIGVSK